MPAKTLGLDQRGKAAKAVRAFVDRTLPEWQVFVRRPNGCSQHFTVTRRHQLTLLAGIGVLALWAAASVALLNRQPTELAAKEREMEAQVVSYRAAEARLDGARRLVVDMAREIDSVHASLAALAQSSAAIAKEKGALAKAPPAAPAARTRVAAEPAYDDSAQPGGAEAMAMREDVRRLEASLERLRATYAQVVQTTTAMADGQIAEAERTLARLGLDPGRLLTEGKGSHPGRGGPFVPLSANGEAEGLSTLLERMERWDGIKGAMQRMPLSLPLKDRFEVNSLFGTRTDPLNNRVAVHEGLDLGGPIGTPVYATGNGTVTLAGRKDRYGLTVDIDHGNGVSTRYAHLSRIKVQVGQKVTRATIIGLLGNSGRSTGPHLHYEVRLNEVPKDPLKFISAGRDAAKIR